MSSTYACQEVAVDRIDPEDSTFRILSYREEDVVFAMDELLGPMPPLWVRQAERDRFILVDGFKRLAWLRKKGRKRVECLIFPEDADPIQLRLRRLGAKLFGPPLNLAEKAQVVAGYSDLLEPEAIHRQVFPRLNLSAHDGAIESWKRIAAHRHQPYLEALAHGLLCERAALLVASWPTEDLMSAVALLSVLRCSASIQVEILERSLDIARRDQLDVATLWRDPDFAALIRHDDWNHRQKTTAVRAWLYRKRFPRLQRREAHFREMLARASFPPTIRLQPPHYFEGRQWRLTIAFSSPDELERQLDTITDRVRSGIVGHAMQPPPADSALSPR